MLVLVPKKKIKGRYWRQAVQEGSGSKHDTFVVVDIVFFNKLDQRQEVWPRKKQRLLPIF